VDGIPPIPDSVAEAVGRYTEFRSATMLGWHPLRREMLITTRFADTAQVHQVRMPGGDRRQLTFFPDKVAGAGYQPTKGDFFVFAKDTGGNEFRQLYRYDLPAGTITLLTDGKSQNGEVVWSTAGDRIAYGSTRRNGKDRDLYVQDPRQPASDRRLAEVEGGAWQAVDWSPDDTKILVLEEISANETYLWLFDAATGTKTAVTPRAGRRRSRTRRRVRADGRSVYTTTDRDSEFQRLARIDLATGKHTYLTSHIDWDVDAFALSRDGKTLAFVTNEDGVPGAPARYGHGRERPVELPGLGPGDRKPGMARQQPRPGLHLFLRALALRRLFARHRHGQGGALDGERDGRLSTRRASPSPSSCTGRASTARPSPVPLQAAAALRRAAPVIVNIHGGPESQYRPASSAAATTT
jgi:dipeptidyl aminopeptidase/acylaminoacyl peptidase